jgi:dCMP deaminase
MMPSDSTEKATSDNSGERPSDGSVDRSPFAGLALPMRLEKLLATNPARPSWDEYFMATALLMATRSACHRLQVGCVLVSGGEHRNRIIAAGYNGFLPGLSHTSRVRDGHEQATVHAEQNAVADAARRGISVDGATAFVSHFPCINCAKILAAAGIRVIKFHLDYKNDPIVKELMAEAEIPLIQL